MCQKISIFGSEETVRLCLRSSKPVVSKAVAHMARGAEECPLRRKCFCTINEFLEQCLFNL